MSGANAASAKILEPGGILFGRQGMRIQTLLGSCVAITFWHPDTCLGAMCHYLVPSCKEGPPGRGGIEAIAMIRDHFRRRGIEPSDLEVKMFGGGNMFPDLRMGATDIGQVNIDEGRRFLESNGFHVHRSDLAGTDRRWVVFDTGSGEVLVQRASSHEGRQG